MQHRSKDAFSDWVEVTLKEYINHRYGNSVLLQRKRWRDAAPVIIEVTDSGRQFAMQVTVRTPSGWQWSTILDDGLSDRMSPEQRHAWNEHHIQQAHYSIDCGMFLEWFTNLYEADERKQVLSVRPRIKAVRYTPPPAEPGEVNYTNVITDDYLASVMFEGGGKYCETLKGIKEDPGVFLGMMLMMAD